MRNNLSEPLDRCYMADEPVSREPVSGQKFPASREFAGNFCEFEPDANRSLSAIEPVSATAKRKLENGEQRPAPETRAQRTEMPEIARQRPAPASLTRGKINDFHRSGKISQETELPG
jgi:hypothetical protein